MELKELQKLVSRAKSEPPPKKLLEFCGDYYSPYYNFIYLAAQEITGVCVELGYEKGRGLLAMTLTGRDVIGFDLNRSPELEMSDYLNVTFA